MAPLVPQQHEVHEDFTLSTLIQKIHTVLGPDGGLDSEHIDPNEIIHLMEQYSSNSKDWSQYTIFDHSRAYTRNLIDDGNGKFNLMILAWSKGQQSPIHNHAGSHCIMKVLDGELSETQYAWPKSSPKQDSSALSTADSSDITDAVVTHADDDEKRPDGKQMQVINLTRLCPNEVTF